MLTIINFIFYVFIIAILNITNKLIEKYKKVLFEKIERINYMRKQLLLHGVTSLYENKLLTMTNSVFIDWCKDYLISIGYSSVETANSDIISIYCYKNNKRYFVLCFKKNPEDNSENNIFHYYFMLLGEMLSKDITNGIIISMDEISKDFINYLDTYNKEIKIEIHDKNKVIDNCLKYKINI